MNNHFYIKELTDLETGKINEFLSISWEVTNNYWYPLKPNNRTDVIAFNADKFKDKFGYQKLREILKDEVEIFEIKEWRDLGRQINVETFEPQYDGDGEGFWFPKNMKWIIYCSHENSISFGGEELIQSIKANWNDWNKHIWG